MALLYVIGLGGAGSKVVLTFAELLRKYGIESNKVKYQIFDMAMEPEILDAINRGVLDDDAVKIIPPYVVENARVQMIAEARSSDKAKWFPEELIPEINLRIRGGQGVERRRPLARLALHTIDISSMVKEELTRDLASLHEAEPSEPILVAIVSSLGGGFGSGTFIDIAAMVRRVARDLGIGSVTILGIFIVPYGYRSMPPAGIRVEFEEENAMAALTELYLLHELARRGVIYRERIGTLGEVDYEPFDLVFLVSFAGVKGTDYKVQFEELDRDIANFLIILALLPYKGAGGGIAISENFLEKYRSVYEVLGPGPNKWKPVVLSFSVTRYDLNVEKLAEFFELLAKYNESAKTLDNIKRELIELDAKLDELGLEVAKVEAEYRRCLEKIDEAKMQGVTLPEKLVKEVESAAKQVAEVAGSGEIRRAVSFVENSYNSWKRTYGDLEAFSALRKLKELLEDEMQALEDEKKRITKELQELVDRVQALHNEYVRLPFYKKMLRGKELKHRIAELEDIKKRKIRELNDIEARLESLQLFTHTELVKLITRVAEEIRPEEMCKAHAEKLKELRRKLEELEKRRYELMDSMSSIETSIRVLHNEYKKMKHDKDITRFYRLFGEEGVEKKLFDLWRSDPEKFKRMSIAELIEAVNPKLISKVEEEINRVFSELNYPLLSSYTTSEQMCLIDCMRVFGEEVHTADQSTRDMILRGIHIFIADEKDAKLVRGGYTLTLSGVGSTIWGFAVFPVLPFTCTKEYEVLRSEYLAAKHHYPSLYRRLHVLPIREFINKLGLKDVEELLVEPMHCKLLGQRR